MRSGGRRASNGEGTAERGRGRRGGRVLKRDSDEAGGRWDRRIAELEKEDEWVDET